MVRRSDPVTSVFSPRIATRVLVCGVVVLFAGGARGDDSEPPPKAFSPDFVLHDWRAEPLAIGLAVAPALGLLIEPSHAGGAPDAAHARQNGAATASDVLEIVGLAITIGGAALGEAARDRAFRLDHLRAALVVAEAALFGSTVTILPKRLVGRCRPYDWIDVTHTCDASADGDDAYYAMWSGHTATTAAAAGAASCLALRDGKFGWPAVVGIAGEVISITTGALRVAAGAHSWSDVAAGFGAGNALGVVMCAIHPRAEAPSVAVVPYRDATSSGASLSLRF